MASPTQWTWVWVDSRSWWWTGRSGMLWFMGHKESDTTEWLNWTELNWVSRLSKAGYPSYLMWVDLIKCLNKTRLIKIEFSVCLTSFELRHWDFSLPSDLNWNVSSSWVSSCQYSYENCTIRSPGSLACQLPVFQCVRFHNHMSHFLILNRAHVCLCVCLCVCVCAWVYSTGSVSLKTTD